MNVSNWRFHHVGIATTSIESFANRLNELSSNSVGSFEDPLQGVRGMFIEIGNINLEILEPLDGDATLMPWLTVGNRMYQIAFEVDDLNEELATARENKIRIVREAHPAVAFDGRRVAFMMPAPGILIELIESPAN
jgi:methylmalonyl-CoA/ethylmalonyl-CoA epimerase